MASKNCGEMQLALSSIRNTKNLRTFLFLCLLIVATSACATSGSSAKDVTYFNVRSAEGSGIMDCSGNWVIKPRSDGYFTNVMADGLAPFYQNGQISTPFVYINSDGEVAFNAEFRLAAPFSEGLAAVLVEDQWGFIDTTGKFAIEPRYSYSPGGNYIGNFSDGLVNVVEKYTVYHTPESWIYVDKQGNQILGPYQSAASFTNGAAAVTLITEEVYKTGYINPEGEFLLEFSQEEGLVPTGSYSAGLFAVKDVSRQIEEGKCAIGFMNQDKEWVIEPQFCYVGLFVSGLAPVSRDEANSALGSYGYINTKGERMIDEVYNFPTNFAGGCALVHWDKFQSSGLIDTEGELIYQFNSVE